LATHEKSLDQFDVVLDGLFTPRAMPAEEDDEENIVSTTFTSAVTAYGVCLGCIASATAASASPYACTLTLCTTTLPVVQPADRTTTIHHWQLRDLISAADNEYEFFCVDEQQVFSYNVKNKEVRQTSSSTQPPWSEHMPTRSPTCVVFVFCVMQSKVVANLDFAPTSMTCRRGFLAAGGAHGEVRGTATIHPPAAAG
jgi:hypothetical protein